MTLADTLRKAAEDSRLLVEDLQAMINNKKKGDPSTASRKSLEPITRLRKNTEELLAAEERSPEEQFVIDKLKDIIGG